MIFRHFDSAAAANWAAAVTESPPGVSPTLTLALGLMTLLGLTIPPIVVAFINRGSKSKPIDLSHLPADVVMPRAQYDQLLDWYARVDDEVDRIAKERDRLRAQLDAERVAHALELARLGAEKL